VIRRFSVVGARFRIGTGLGLLLCLAPGLSAGDHNVDVAPGSARRSGNKPAPGTPASPVPDRALNLPSLGPGISPGSLPDAPVATPYQPGKIDPEAQRRWLLLEDKKRNWLLESAANANSKRTPGDAEVMLPGRSLPTDSISKISAERIRRAVERPEPKLDPSAAKKAETSLANEAEADDTEQQRGKEDGGNDPTKPKPILAFASGGFGDGGRATDPKRSSVPGDIFQTPSFVGLEERQRDRTTGRGAEFDQLLGGIGQGPGNNNGIAGGLELGRTTQDRSRRFEAILTGDSGLGSSAITPPLAALAAPVRRPDPSLDSGRINAIQLPGAAPVAAPVAAPILQPRPIFLQLPVRGL
jgi:hypothetical protein